MLVYLTRFTYFRKTLNLIDEWRAAEGKNRLLTSKCIPSLVKLYISESRFRGAWIDDT